MRFTISHHTEHGWNEILLNDTLNETAASVIPSAGAILNAFSIMHAGNPINVIDGFRDVEDWRARIEEGFHSAKLSPFVCRLRDSRYQWQGTSYKLDKFSLNGAAIHGILYDAPFDIIEEKIHPDYAEIELRHSYRGDINGYPFPYDCYIRYRLDDNNGLSVITAIHNRSSSPIPLVDGWHPYFRIGERIDELTLCFSAAGRLEYDEGLLPTGRLLETGEWSEPRKIGDSFLDDGFKLDFGYAQTLCRLSDPLSGLSVAFQPDPSYPYLQLYTPPHRRSIAIENLSGAPDAFNNSIGLITLDPDHTRTFSLRYVIEKE